MMRIRVVAAFCALLLAGANRATAQQRAMVVPADAPRWDVAGQVGWLGGKKRVQSVDWFSAASVSGSVGYYWTPHVKLEAEVGTSSKSSFYSQQPLVLPGTTLTAYASRQHQIGLTTVSTTIAYQIFENQWVHPFLSAGADIVREHDQGAVAIAYLPPPDPRSPPVQVVADAARTQVNRIVRPAVGGGFKFYVSPRAFVRTDARWTFADDGVATVHWRGGLGIDF